MRRVVLPFRAITVPSKADKISPIDNKITKICIGSREEADFAVGTIAFDLALSTIVAAGRSALCSVLRSRGIDESLCTLAIHTIHPGGVPP